MAIDRQAFDRCFVPQHSERIRAVPNLIHERLFATYDSNGDGLIGFREFVTRNIEIHGDHPEVKRALVFKGVDLDDDGYISRRDFLRLFKAWHALKKIILVDYMRADAAGEDARSVVDLHDPRDHVLSGRPLTSHFNYERPPFGPNPRQTEGKSAEQSFLPAVRENFEQSDTLTRREVIDNTWINPLQAVDMDLICIARGQKPSFLSSEQARLFHENDTAEDPNWVEHDHMWWARFRPQSNGGVYLKVTRADLPNDTINFRPVMYDRQQWEQTVMRICCRLYENLDNFLHNNGPRRLEEREQYRQFHLSDETNTFSTPLGLPDLYSRCITNQPNVNGLAAGESLPKPRQGNDHFTSDRRSSAFVGDTAAADTVYRVIQEALNELLDPLFKPCESLAIEIDKTAEERKEVAVLLHNEHCGRYARSFLNAMNLVKAEGTQGAPFHVERMMKSFLTMRALLARAPDTKPSLSGMEPALTDGAFKWFRPAVVDDNYLANSWAEGEETLRLIIAQSRAQRDRLGAELQRRGAAREQAVDPTMPQHRPDSAYAAAAPVNDGFTPERLDYLYRLEECQRRLRKGGCKPGSLNYDEFAELVGQTDEEGRKLLGFVGGWLDVVMF